MIVAIGSHPLPQRAGPAPMIDSSGATDSAGADSWQQRLGALIRQVVSHADDTHIKTPSAMELDFIVFCHLVPSVIALVLLKRFVDRDR